MNRQPQRISIDKEYEKQIKEKYGYSFLYAFSASFLEEYKEKIIDFFPNPAAKLYLQGNMDQIKEFFIADRISNGLSRLCCGGPAIQMDIEFADITDTSFKLKEGYDYIETIFIHELLHAATRQKGNNRNLTGVLEFIRDENGKVVDGPNNRKNVGLNEGLTQFFAEKISGSRVPDEIDSYTFNKNIVYLLSEVLGEDVLKTSYFGNGSNLKDVLNALSQDANFYDDFNKRLDTITKMEATIRKMKKGTLIPNDKESTARMEAVAEAQKTALIENLFAKVIIPQVQKIEVPVITDFENTEQRALHNAAIQKRQAILLSMLKKQPDLLKSVAKYIPDHVSSTYATDKTLSEMQKEILENGMNFDKIAQMARRVTTNHKVSSRINKDFLGAVDEFYKNNPDALKDRSTTMTPLLQRQLKQIVGVLVQLEELALKNPNPTTEKSVRDYRENFLRKHFHQISNLDEEIEKIRQEIKNTKNKTESEPEISEEVAQILEEARKKGENDALSIDQTPKEDEPNQENNQVVTRNFTLDDKFIVDNQVGTIIDQRNLTISQKVQNIVRATGEFDITKDPVLTKMTTTSAENYVESISQHMSSQQIQALKKSFGEDWQKVLQESYEKGYRAGLEIGLKNAKKEGMTERNKIEETIKKGILPEESKTQISLEEVKYVNDNFDVKITPSGETIVVDKVTEQPIISERTKATTLFAKEWSKITGEKAFSTEQAEVYRFIQVEAIKPLTEEGKINPSTVLTDAEVMGEKYKSVTQQLFSSQKTVSVVENFFAHQTPNVKKKEVEVHSNVEQINADSVEQAPNLEESRRAR